jgi:hypothetical protein
MTARVAGFTSTATVLGGPSRPWIEGTINDLKLWLMRAAIGRGVACDPVSVLASTITHVMPVSTAMDLHHLA